MELERALQQRAEIDKKIKALQESMRLLGPIYGQTPSYGSLQELASLSDIKDLGITAAIERVLMCVPNQWMPPTSVRNALVEAGFELAGDNPLASIHQVLKRLVARNGPYVSEEIDGQTMYKFDPASDSKSLLGMIGTDALATEVARRATAKAARIEPIETSPASVRRRLARYGITEKEKK